MTSTSWENSLATKESGSQSLKQENKRPSNRSWRTVSSTVSIVAHDGIGHDGDDAYSILNWGRASNATIQSLIKLQDQLTRHPWKNISST